VYVSVPVVKTARSLETRGGGLPLDGSFCEACAGSAPGFGGPGSGVLVAKVS
jgi:hypothetical protein